MPTLSPRERFEEMIEFVKAEKTVEGKLDALSMMVFAMATNDLTCIEQRQANLEETVKKLCADVEKKFKKITLMGAGILIAVLFQIPIDKLFSFIIGLL